MTWLRILGEPERVFHSAATDRALLVGQGSPHELLVSVGELRSAVDGETPNVSVSLSNRRGDCKRLFPRPPVGVMAELRDASGVLFAGVVQKFALGSEVCVLNLETNLARPLPLRRSTDWGGFRESVLLPQRYGDCSGGLIQYNEERTIFCWADHACEAIDAVSVGGQPAGDWQWDNIVDSTGHVICVVIFGEPQDEGAELSATGRGKMHPNPPGQRMVNPATVIWDVLANLAGWPIVESQLEEFRRACELAGLEVGNSIETEVTAQTVARSICESIGAAFCADAPGLCRLLPDADMPAPRAVITTGDVDAEADLDSLCNDLTVEYGFVGDEPTGTVQMEAPDYVAADGRRSETLEARWITSPRVAFAVATRVLGDRARPRYVQTVAGVKKALQVFDAIEIAHPGFPELGSFSVRSRVVSMAVGTSVVSTVSVLSPVGDAPSLRLVRQASAFTAQLYIGGTVQTIGTDRVFRLTEQDGTPLVGAKVTANTFSRYTDAAGRVVFPISALPAGAYVFIVLAADGRTWPWPVTIQ